MMSNWRKVPIYLKKWEVDRKKKLGLLKWLGGARAL